MEFFKNIRFQISLFLKKNNSKIFQKSFTKYLVHKIKNHQSFQYFDKYIGKIGKKCQKF